MRTGSLIIAIVTAAFVGWVAPTLSGDGGESKSAVAAAPAAAGDATAQSRREAWLSGDTVLERQDDGHFYADVLIDSRATHFLVDTGASIVALTGQDAEAAGLTWNKADLVEIGRGANGAVYGVPVHLDRVELGGYEAHDVDAAIIPDGLEVSLLGQSFLAGLKDVRIEGDRMMLGGES